MIEPAATGEGVGGWAGRAVQVWLGEVPPLLFRARQQAMPLKPP